MKHLLRALSDSSPYQALTQKLAILKKLKFHFLLKVKTPKPLPSHLKRPRALPGDKLSLWSPAHRAPSSRAIQLPPDPLGRDRCINLILLLATTVQVQSARQRIFHSLFHTRCQKHFYILCIIQSWPFCPFQMDQIFVSLSFFSFPQSYSVLPIHETMSDKVSRRSFVGFRFRE